jgi:hypothetical protein
VVHLQWRAVASSLLEGVSDWFMIREEAEVASFQDFAEILHGIVGSKFSIISNVFLLRWIQLLGEGKALPGTDTLLKRGTPGRSESVCNKCKWRGWVLSC